MRYLCLFLLLLLIAGCNVLGGSDEDVPPDTNPDPIVESPFGTPFPGLFADDADLSSFGYSVAAGDDYVVVGAPLDSDNGDAAGAAYVFTNSGGTWTEAAKLTASDGAAGDSFGFSVATSGDFILVGAYADDDGGIESGSAYLFERSGSSWNEVDKVVPVDAGEQDKFGWNVAMSDEYAIITAYEDDNNGTDSGSAFVFERDGRSLTEVSTLRPDTVAELDRFGISVAMSGDYAVIGASDDDDDGNNSGSAYVFELTGGAWTEVSQLRADDADIRDRFGRAVAVDEGTIVVGSYRDDDNGDASGSAYVFGRSSGGEWTQTSKLTASDGAVLDHFGRAVAIDGSYLIVGADQNDEGGEDAGAAYVFELNGSTWTEVTKLTANSSDDTSGFGYTAAMNDDLAVLGAYNADNPQNGAYIFEK